MESRCGRDGESNRQRERERKKKREEGFQRRLQKRVDEIEKTARKMMKRSKKKPALVIKTIPGVIG